MDNKEIKTNMTELNDEALENVSGGEYIRLLKPADLDPIKTWSITCAGCGKKVVLPYEGYDATISSKKHYCDDCKANQE